MRPTALIVLVTALAGCGGREAFIDQAVIADEEARWRAIDQGRQREPAAKSARPFTIDEAVKHCVDEVRTRSDASRHFDAFYNRASGAVQNNVMFVYERQSLFWFQKCLAVQGFPLQ